MTSDHPTPDPILASWKLSQVLDRYPQVLDTLAGLSPILAPLRNPLGTLESRLMTVSQAAGIAGLDPAELTRRLNREVGITLFEEEPAVVPASAPDHAEPPPPPWVGSAPVAETVDVRPVRDQSEEPLQAIMAAARDVPVGEVLRVIVGFEPLPLYDAMARLGFVHHTRRVDHVWQVDFLRERTPGGVEPSTSTGVE